MFSRAGLCFSLQLVTPVLRCRKLAMQPGPPAASTLTCTACRACGSSVSELIRSAQPAAGAACCCAAGKPSGALPPLLGLPGPPACPACPPEGCPWLAEAAVALPTAFLLAAVGLSLPVAEVLPACRMAKGDLRELSRPHCGFFKGCKFKAQLSRCPAPAGDLLAR